MRCAVILVTLTIAALTGCIDQPMSPREPTPGAFHFTIQTFNVELRHASDAATVEAVGASGADIIALQEVTPAWEEALRARYSADYDYLLFQSSDTAGGLAVLSRYPVVDQGFHDGPNGWHPAWHVGVDTPRGPVQLLDVHLRSPLTGHDSALESAFAVGSDHLDEIQDFSEECNGDVPTLVVGDFNEDTSGEAVQYLEGVGYRNALPLFHPGQGTWRYRSVGGQFDKTYDHILFDDAFAPLDAWVTRDGNSDHLPVLARFEESSSW